MVVQVFGRVESLKWSKYAHWNHKDKWELIIDRKSLCAVFAVNSQNTLILIIKISRRAPWTENHNGLSFL